MNPGMPGVGISGLFYVLMVLYMPLRQLAVGRAASSRQWRFISRHLTYVVCMIGVFILEGMFLKSITHLLEEYFPTLSRLLILSNSNVIMPAATVTPFICLGLVIVLVQLLRLLLGKRHPYGQGTASQIASRTTIVPAAVRVAQHD
jgi:hypothetical protein